MAERERSAVYPYALWSDCVEFIKQIDSFSARSVSYDEVSKKSNVTPQAYSFKAKLSTSRQFGLIETGNGVISLSELAKKLLYPVDEEDISIKYECFANPPLYSKLIELYNGKAIPSEAVLGNILMNNHRIAKKAKDIAAKFFLQNAQELGFIRAGVLNYTLESDSSNHSDHIGDDDSDNDNRDFDNEETAEHEIKNDAIQSHSYPSYDINYIKQTIPTESGELAQIIIPLKSTEDDLWLIRDTLDVIMKRKFKINLE